MTPVAMPDKPAYNSFVSLQLWLADGRIIRRQAIAVIIDEQQILIFPQDCIKVPFKLPEVFYELEDQSKSWCELRFLWRMSNFGGPLQSFNLRRFPEDF